MALKPLDGVSLSVTYKCFFKDYGNLGIIKKMTDIYKQNSPLVSIIIVNWNGKHLIEECIESLRNQTFRDFEVIVVDNGSTDGSSEFIKNSFPEVKLVLLSSNKGFAGGNNAGIKIAKGKYIALLNNDTKADPRWLENIVEIANSTPDAGMWASKILSYYKTDTIDNVGLLIYKDGIARGKGRLEQDNGQYNIVTEAFVPSGCAALYRKEMLDKIGLFDEDFFAYADDVDIGLRGRIAGWKCLYVPNAIVYHKYSASSSSYSALKAFLVERNRIWILLKYFPCDMILVSPYFTLKRMLIMFLGAITGKGASGKFSRNYSFFYAIYILLKAWCSAILYLPKIIRQRKQISGIKKITNRELRKLINKFSISATELALKD